MLILFVFTLATAFHYELSRFTTDQPKFVITIPYFVGSIFFLFWSEPYIIPLSKTHPTYNVFHVLALIQLLSLLVNSINKPNFAYKWNKVESKITLSLLVVAAVYAIKYFYEIV